MPKRKTTEEFIADAKKVHGDKYDYSKVLYKNTMTKVLIICNKCGNVFSQTPNDHLDGCGCPKCGKERIKSKLYGVGINDLDEPISNNGKHFKFYLLWRAMMYRCYYKVFHKREQTYADCIVCDEWKYLSNFKKWFDENYREGCQLDKDILVRGNKIYSPDTCCFVPQELNVLFTDQKRCRREHIGVYRKKGGYYFEISERGKSLYFTGFNTLKEAAEGRRKERTRYVREMADEYFEKGKISKKVRDAMYVYQVREDD